MKVIVALLALLAVCSAHVFKRQMPNTNCNDVAALSYINNVNPEVCDSVNTTANDTCGDECLGRACTYYTSNGYTTLCLSIIAIGCYTGSSGSGTVAATCQRCFDRQVLAVYLGLPASCNTDNFNARDFCRDECVGASCTFYSDNGYPTDCRTDLAQLCGGMTAPAACRSDSGPTQVTGGSDSSGPTQVTGGSDSSGPTQATGVSDSSGPTQATGGSDSEPTQATGGSDSSGPTQATGGSMSGALYLKEVAVFVLLVALFVIF